MISSLRCPKITVTEFWIEITCQVSPIPPILEILFENSGLLFYCPAFSERTLLETSSIFGTHHLISACWASLWPLQSFKYLKIITVFTFGTFGVILHVIFSGFFVCLFCLRIFHSLLMDNLLPTLPKEIHGLKLRVLNRMGGGMDVRKYTQNIIWQITI